MTTIQYANKGTKVKDSAVPQLEWPLISGMLMSSDTTRLGPEGQEATYIDEEYQNDNGDKISVSKALYPDGYRSISILDNVNEFHQGYRPDGSINYTTIPNKDMKNQNMNYFEYTDQLIPKGQHGLNKGIQPGAYLVTFPDQNIYVKNQINKGKGALGAFGNFVVDLFDGRKDSGRWRLGHSGVITVDANGRTQYHEYGRYGQNDPGTLQGSAQFSSSNGNWNRRSVPDVSRYLDKKRRVDHDAYAQALLKTFGENVDLTFVDNTDPQKVRQAIQDDANNINRDKYSIFSKSCGSEACSVIDAGQSGWEQFGDGVKRVLNAVNPLNFRTSPVNAIFGGFTPTAKREGVEAAGYKTYSARK